MTRTLRLTEQDLRRFADASGDENPLHLDELFARTTPHGRCIAHGALVTIAALGSVDADALGRTRRLDVQFKQPIFPGDLLEVSCSRQDIDTTKLEVRAVGRLAVSITLAAEHGLPARLPAPDAQSPRDREPPREHTLEGLRRLDGPITARYAGRIDLLRVLADELGAGDVPDVVVTWLAAASYTVGMLVPGRDAVFVGARLGPSPGDGSGRLSASVRAVDDRTGLVMVDADLDRGAASARLALQAFLRAPVPAPDRASIGRRLRPSSALAGRNALVVGASRGLGAAMVGALATQQATVWAGFARSRSHAERLRAEFGEQYVRLLQFDAQDPEQCKRALSEVRARVAALHGLVICAAPPARETALHVDAAEAVVRFVDASVAATLIPVAGALPTLSPDGWVVLTSSTAVTDSPPGLPQQVIAKAAVEAVAAYCAKHTSARVLVVRAPRMLTDSANTPLGRIGAVPPEQVAASVVRWVTAPGADEGVSLLGPDEVSDHADL